MVLDVGVLVDLCEPELQGLATASLQQLSLYPSPGLGGGDDNDKLGVVPILNRPPPRADQTRSRTSNSSIATATASPGSTAS